MRESVSSHTSHTKNTQSYNHNHYSIHLICPVLKWLIRHKFGRAGHIDTMYARDFPCSHATEYTHEYYGDLFFSIIINLNLPLTYHSNRLARAITRATLSLHCSMFPSLISLARIILDSLRPLHIPTRWPDSQKLPWFHWHGIFSFLFLASSPSLNF